MKEACLWGVEVSLIGRLLASLGMAKNIYGRCVCNGQSVPAGAAN